MGKTGANITKGLSAFGKGALGAATGGPGKALLGAATGGAGKALLGGALGAVAGKKGAGKAPVGLGGGGGGGVPSGCPVVKMTATCSTA